MVNDHVGCEQVVKAAVPPPEAQLQYDVVWQAEQTVAPGAPVEECLLQPGDISWRVRSREKPKFSSPALFLDLTKCSVRYQAGCECSSGFIA